MRLKAIVSMEKGNYDEAIQILEDLKTSSSNKVIIFLLGLSYHKKNNHKQAITLLREFEKTSPENKEFHYYLAIL